MNGNAIGSQLVLNNGDNKRKMLIRACNTIDGFKSNAEEWREVELNSWLKSGAQIQKQEFTYDTAGGKEIAQLSLQISQSNVTNYFFGQSWMQGQVFVTCDALGEGVQVAGDNEIADIISSIVIK